MKKLTLIGVGILASIAVLATLPTFKTTSATGTSSASAYFAADPNSQIRIVSADLTSDLSSSTLTFTTGAGAYWQTWTNVASSSVTNAINSTNGLTVGAEIVLWHAGIPYSAIVTNWIQNTNALPSGGTNVVLMSGGWAVAASVGDQIELQSTNTAIAVGAVTNSWINGEAVYVGNYGRGVRAKLTGTSACAITVLSAHYDSQSQ